LLERLHASRLFRMLLPRAAGGDDAEPALYVAEELARHDASIAWNVLVANRSCLIAAYLEPAANQAVFADPRSTMQGLYAVGVAAVGFGIATCTRSRSRFRHAALDNMGKIVKQTTKVYTMMLFGTLNFSHTWYDPKGNWTGLMTWSISSRTISQALWCRGTLRPAVRT
jgi:hypothetical protein